jgi:hypothetical protein
MSPKFPIAGTFHGGYFNDCRHTNERTCPVAFTLTFVTSGVRKVFLTKVSTGYPILGPVSAMVSVLKGLRSYKSARIQRQRTTRQPTFVSPLVDIENGLGSTNFPPFNSGLCKASSGSARFGDRLDPHCVGSGAREYWTDKLTCDYVYAKILAPFQPIRFLDWEEEIPNAP